MRRFIMGIVALVTMGIGFLRMAKALFEIDTSDWVPER